MVEKRRERRPAGRYLALLALAAVITALFFTGSMTGLLVWLSGDQAAFGEGAYANTFYNSTLGGIQLNATYLNGSYVSKAFDAGSNSTWNNITWHQGGRYQEELPAAGTDEPGPGGMNMTGNVLLFRFNNDSAYGENDTHAYDFSGSGNNGTGTGFEGDEVSGSGLMGGAFDLDGTDDYVELPASSQMVSGTAYTLSAWIKTDTQQGSYGTEGRVINLHRAGGSYSSGAVIYAGGPGGSEPGDADDICMLYYTGSGHEWLCYQTSPAYHDGRWHLVSATHDGSVARLFYDGVQVNSRSDTQGALGTSTGKIGSFDGASRYFDGMIDEAAVWNRSLSPAEMLDIYRRGALRLDLSVRSCQAACSGEGWTALNGTSPQGLPVPGGRYFQYMFNFSTQNASHSPELYNVTVDYGIITLPAVNISLVHPAADINVTQDEFFNFTVNVSCSGADCGQINVTLDPTEGDSSQSDFNSGAYFRTFYNTSGFVQLNATYTAGNFTSQAFDANGEAQWNNMSWFTELPYGRELPAGQQAETGHFLRGADMTGNVLLFRFNNGSSHGENDTHIYDFSGKGHNGTAYSATWNSSGKLGGAFGFDGSDDYISLEGTASGGTRPLELNGSFSIAFWFYPTESKSFYIMGNYEGDGAYSGQHINIDGDPVGSGVDINCHIDDGTNTASAASGELALNQWHHAVIVRDKGNMVYTYINGIEESSDTDDVTGSVLSDKDWVIGAKAEATAEEQFKGMIDEVAVWNRSLSSSEMLDIYRRGALRLNLSVRNCSSPDCSDGSWQGLGGESPQDLGLSGQRFQYGFMFGTDDSARSPVLYNTTLDYTPVSLAKGLVSTAPGDTPFYTNATSNPLTISLNEGQSQLVTFWVNATGTGTYEFFAYANLTGDPDTSDSTPKNNITIMVNYPPSVSIGQAIPPSPSEYGTYVFMNASASDYEDGDLTANITWHSDLDGPLGTGGSFNLSLSLGSHTITANVTDSEGAPATDTEPYVIQDTAPPAIAGASITPGLTSGEEATVRASITESPSSISYAWFSVNDTSGAITNHSMPQEGSTDYHNGSFFAGPAGTYSYIIYSNDTAGNTGNTGWMQFFVTPPVSSANITTTTIPVGNTGIITTTLNATDPIKEVNITINVASYLFQFQPGNIQSPGNLSAGSLTYVEWNTTPTSSGEYPYNFTWTDLYGNQYSSANSVINVTSPVATPGNEQPSQAYPSSVISITAGLDASDSIRGLYAHLNVPSGFAFIETASYPQNQSLGNVSAGNATARWYVSVPATEGPYTYNVTWTDIYGDTWQGDDKPLEVTYSAPANLSNITYVDITDTPEIEIGAVYISEISVRDGYGAYANASGITVTIYSSTGAAVSGPVSYTTSGNQVATGRYNYTYQTVAGQPAGYWTTSANVSRNGQYYEDRNIWRLTGGPFDVRDITVNDNTITSLSISVTLENTGGSNQDMTVVWNLTRTGTGEQLDSGSDTVMVPASSEKSYSFSPSTTYLGEVQVTVLGYYSGTEKAGAFKIFDTTEEAAPEPPAPSGGGPQIPVGGGAAPGEPEEPECSEDWSCTGWSECLDGYMFRVCTDLNGCGTTVNKPPEIRECLEPVTEMPSAVPDEGEMLKVADNLEGRAGSLERAIADSDLVLTEESSRLQVLKERLASARELLAKGDLDGARELLAEAGVGIGLLEEDLSAKGVEVYMMPEWLRYYLYASIGAIIALSALAIYLHRRRHCTICKLLRSAMKRLKALLKSIVSQARSFIE